MRLEDTCITLECKGLCLVCLYSVPTKSLSADETEKNFREPGVALYLLACEDLPSPTVRHREIIDRSGSLLLTALDAAYMHMLMKASCI
jgi:hypothetical protein